MWMYLFTIAILWLISNGVSIMFPHFSKLTKVAIYILSSILLYVLGYYFGNAIVILLTIMHNIVYGFIFGKRALLNGMNNIGEKNRQKYNDKNNQ